MRWWSLALMLIGAAVSAAPSAEQQQALRYLIKQDCGSCHGLTLKGGLGPALTPAALADKSTELLVNSIMYGRPGTAMPPWQGLLSWEEAVWMIEQLRKGIP